MDQARKGPQGEPSFLASAGHREAWRPHLPTTAFKSDVSVFPFAVGGED